MVQHLTWNAVRHLSLYGRRQDGKGCQKEEHFDFPSQKAQGRLLVYGENGTELLHDG